MRLSRVLLADDHPSLAAALKVHAPTELVHAIRTVLSGGTFVSTAIAV